MKVAFFGTPHAAVPSLLKLNASRHEVVCVVTAPDRPQGRGMNLDAPPVKKAAQQCGLPVMQTPTLKSPEIQEQLAGLGADLFVVVAFGFILPRQVLETPKFGCINVHFSLLPYFRGAAPVQWALIQGHATTGITIMQLDEGMDTGPMLARLEDAIFPEDNTETVEARLADLGADMLVTVVDQIEDGQASPEAQDDSLATYASKISTEAAHIDWSEPAETIFNKVRGLTPRPGAWGMLHRKRLKIWKVSYLDSDFGGDACAAGDDSSPNAAKAPEGAPGTIEVIKGHLLVRTATGWLSLDEVQPEGKARMAAADFVRGYRPLPGDRIS
ncbi:MAG: methionyl-tRNA formyltransferase [Actinomycetota bacterium]